MCDKCRNSIRSIRTAVKALPIETVRELLTKSGAKHENAESPREILAQSVQMGLIQLSA